MKRWWKVQSARIDALTLRERAMMFVVALACCLALADFLWLAPAQSRNNQVQASVKKQSAELQVLREQLRAGLSSAPGAQTGQVVQTELTLMQSRLANVNREIAGLSSMTGDSAELAKVLVHFLKHYDGLTLERTATLAPDPASGNPQAGDGPAGLAARAVMPTLPAAPAIAPTAGSLVQKGIELMMSGSQAGGGPGAPGTKPAPPVVPAATGHVVRQGIELTVSGSYMDLMRYVQTLEKALPTVRWGKMKLSSGKSSSQLTLQLYLVEVLP